MNTSTTGWWAVAVGDVYEYEYYRMVGSSCGRCVGLPIVLRFAVCTYNLSHPLPGPNSPHKLLSHNE